MNPPRPLQLPRLVMRRATVVALATCAAAALSGLWATQEDIEQEVEGALALASQIASVQALAGLDDAAALQQLAALQAGHGLRHLRLQLHDAGGRALLPPPPAEPAPWPLAPLDAAYRRWLSPADERHVAWPLPRPDGQAWTLQLTASHEAERREALGNLAGMLGALGATVAGLLAVMHLQLRRAFRPLQQLLQAVAQLAERDQRAQVARLPAMPVQELDDLAQALRAVAQELDGAEEQRRRLSQKLLTLQEDERAHLARDLHDEFGQRLTALRVGLTWLARQLPTEGPLRTRADALREECALGQQEVRRLLGRLRPDNPALDPAAGQPTLGSLHDMLRDLLQRWTLVAPDPQGPQLRLDVTWPAAALARPVTQDLALAVYRMSQEALTNACRHAGAKQVCLRLSLTGPTQTPHLRWEVADDGRGLPDMHQALRQGRGLAGLQERAWAHRGRLQLEAGPGGRGLVLRAELPLPAA
ncbi:ATP-binding protein [Ideonella livida]|uniref:HAMP domain-containing protein n=1 Tax=Ideonella livida TaxID=2707176 RepID=A0A7C9PJC5_9BURK|nr:histidine kinase [Ideonella livida]NDY92671.1 hypothetical protein [Ideonella livida]